MLDLNDRVFEFKARNKDEAIAWSKEIESHIINSEGHK
jgi:hypothetical protein